MLVYLVATDPRPPIPSEKTYVHIQEDGSKSRAKQLPCWLDSYNAERKVRSKTNNTSASAIELEPPEVFVSLVVPAYNEEQRLSTMLKEAADYLEENYSTAKTPSGKASISKTQNNSNGSSEPKPGTNGLTPTGYEILVVSDGSTDATIQTALSFAKTLPPKARNNLRVVSLAQNRGKGGAVTHGMRHVRGQYAIFADADGASRFADMGSLVGACRAIEDRAGRGVAVGSRAHLVGSSAVVKRSRLRNFLMHSFHLLLRLLTPPATGRIKDTQCGFKLFSRAALRDIVPYMHSEGWIFDVEMLMLAESAGIRVVECPVGWHEVGGSKLNVVWDSLGMAWGLAVLRCAWGMGIYRRS